MPALRRGPARSLSLLFFGTIFVLLCCTTFAVGAQARKSDNIRNLNLPQSSRSAHSHRSKSLLLSKEPPRFIVHLSERPVAHGNHEHVVFAQHDTLRRSVKESTVPVSIRYLYGHALNAAAVEAANDTDPSEVEDFLKSLDFVTGVTQATTYPRVRPPRMASVSRPRASSTTAEDTDPVILSALKIVGADKVNLTGKDVRIGIIDTGVDYRQAVLGGGFGVGRKIRYGYNCAYRRADPFETCDGHGTAVSSIIGANRSGRFRGVAPDATLGVYAVQRCTDDVIDEEDILCAIDAAARDKMQVINLSLGIDSFQGPTVFTTALQAYVQSGGIVVAAAGNGGWNAFAVTYPGNTDGMITVGSVDNAIGVASIFSLSVPDAAQLLNVTYVPFDGAPLFPTRTPLTLVVSGADTEYDACGQLDAGAVSGKVVLVRRGSCTARIKTVNAALAGAVGVIVYDNVDDTRPLALTMVDPSAPDGPLVPTIGITQSAGQMIADTLARSSQPVTITFRDGDVNYYGTSRAGSVSSFSAAGPGRNLRLKPDLVAPGGSMLLLQPNGTIALGDGTSFAAPVVTGCIALLLQQAALSNSSVKPTVESLRALFATTAAIVAVDQSMPAIPAPVFVQGAGIVRIDRAAASQLYTIDAPLIELQDRSNRSLTIKFSATDFNSLSTSTTFSVSHVAAYTAVLNGSPVDTDGNPVAAAVTVSPSSFTLSRTRRSVMVQITVSADTLPTMSLYSGFVVVSSGSTSYQLRYGGVTGYPDDFAIFDPKRIALGSASKILTRPPYVFYLTGDSFPSVYHDLQFPIGTITYELQRRTGSGVYVITDSRTYRSLAFSTPGFTFNGQYTPGSYNIAVTVSTPKITAGSKPVLTQRWLSTIFEIRAS